MELGNKFFFPPKDGNDDNYIHNNNNNNNRKKPIAINMQHIAISEKAQIQLRFHCKIF